MSKKKRTHNKSIVKQVYYLNTVFVVGWLLILCVVFTQFAYFYNSVISSSVQENVEKYATDMEYEFDKLEKNIYTLIGGESLFSDLTAAESEDFLTSYNARMRLSERINDFGTQYSYVNSTSIYTVNGSIIAGNDSAGSIVAGEQKEMFGYYITENDNKCVFLITRIINRSGRDIGKLALELNVAEMYDIEHSENDAEFIIAQEGGIAGYNVPKNIKLSEYIPDSGIKYKSAKINGVSVFVTMLAKEDNKFTYCRITETALVAEKVGRFVMLIGAGILILMIYITLFSFRHIKSITQPIQEMKDDLAELEKNNYNISKFGNVADDTENEIYIFRKQLYGIIERMDGYVEENYIMECRIKEAQLKQLHAQINPHFLYNTLNILYWCAAEREQDDIALIIKNMGELFRSSIDTTEDMIPLKQEIKMMKKYVEIHKIRFRERLTVVMDIDEDCDDILIPRFSIQPILENSIIATVQNKMGNYTIKILVKKKEETIEICVLDEGDGISEEMLKKIKDGTYNLENNISALYNIDQRIKYLFGGDYGIFAGRKEEMAAVGFVLPVK